MILTRSDLNTRDLYYVIFGPRKKGFKATIVILYFSLLCYVTSSRKCEINMKLKTAVNNSLILNVKKKLYRIALVILNDTHKV
jgi:hypothetical protein